MYFLTCDKTVISKLINMKQLHTIKLLIIFAIISTFIHASCKKPPFKPEYENIGGFVIGKETCNTDDTQDYWLKVPVKN